MVPFNFLKQVNADFFELISPDAGQRLRSGRVEIGIDEPVGDGPHGQSRRLHVAEHNALVADNRDRGMQLMAAASQGPQLVTGRATVRRLVEASLPERERLISS